MPRRKRTKGQTTIYITYT